jgi:hypothetical protein
LGFVFASDEGSATIRIIIFITEGLGFIIQLLKKHLNNKP